jgi:hypothetical protein
MDFSYIRYFRPLRALSFILMLLVVPLSAGAVTELLLQLDTSQRFDSNPFRFTKDAAIPAAVNPGKKNDSIISADVRAAVIHPLDSPDTRLLFIGQIGRRNFNQLDQLDNTEYNYRTAFEWRYGQLWKGTISVGNDQQLYNYLDGSITNREMTHVVNRNADLVFVVSPDIEIPFSVRFRRTEYDTPTNWLFDSHEQIVDVGLRYRSTTRSIFRTGIRSNAVNYPRRTEQQSVFLDSRYKDREIYVDSDWQYSNFTRFSGRVSALNRHYSRLDEKDFTALTTEIKVNHDYSSKTRFNMEIWSRPYGTTDRATLYTLATGVQTGIVWQATAKTRGTLQASKELQRYQSVILDPGQSNPKLSRIRWGAGVVYAIERDISLYIDFFRDRLDRGSLGSTIDQNTVKAGIEYSFENSRGLAQRTGFGARR